MVMQISEQTRAKQTANKETPKSKFTETFMRHIAHETIPISTLPTQTHTQDSLCLHRCSSKLEMDTNEVTFGLLIKQQMEERTDHKIDDVNLHFFDYSGCSGLIFSLTFRSFSILFYITVLL